MCSIPTIPTCPPTKRGSCASVTSFKHKVQARRAERDHTLSLTPAQRYVLRELRLVYGNVEDAALQRQITLLEAGFRQPNPRPAVQKELKRIRDEGVTEMALVDALSHVYSAYGLDAASPSPTAAQARDETPAQVVCSEAGTPQTPITPAHTP